MAVMSLELSEPLKRWIEDQAKAGKFESAETYVRDLIERERERVLDHQELLKDIQEGIDSGPAVDFDMEEFLARMRARAAQTPA